MVENTAKCPTCLLCTYPSTYAPGLALNPRVHLLLCGIWEPITPCSLCWLSDLPRPVPHTLVLPGPSLSEGQRGLSGTCSSAEWERPRIQHHTVDSSRPCGSVKSGIC